MSGVDAAMAAPTAALASAIEAAAPSTGCGGIVAVGLDVVSAAKTARLAVEGGAAFLERGWTPAERAEANGDPERLATRWAAKEAVMKCLGVGISDLDPRDIEIRSSESGTPSVALRGAAAQRAARLGIAKIHVSATHESGWAAAIAVATATAKPEDPEEPDQREDES